MGGCGAGGWHESVHAANANHPHTLTSSPPPPTQPPTHPTQVMQKLWLSVSGMTEKIIFTSVNPILEQYRPAIFNQVWNQVPSLAFFGSIDLYFI